MRRAERLFQIIQVLRRSRRPVTGASLAQELETSKRSIYRDIAALIGQGVPIRGEAGVGYVLEPGFDLPPLMLTLDEIEAAVLGAQWVAGHAEPALGQAAKDLIAKIAAVLPAGHEALIWDASSRTPPSWQIPSDRVDVAKLREATRTGKKIALEYENAAGARTSRIIWPVAIAYLQTSKKLIGWCELRQEFRDFRVDRIAAADVLCDKFPGRPSDLRRRWLRKLRQSE